MLCDWLLERDFTAAAADLGALACAATPRETALHIRLAEAARTRGDRAAFERAALDALSIDPSLPLAAEFDTLPSGSVA
jgi:hypothetical protein